MVAQGAGNDDLRQYVVVDLLEGSQLVDDRDDTSAAGELSQELRCGREEVDGRARLHQHGCDEGPVFPSARDEHVRVLPSYARAQEDLHSVRADGANVLDQDCVPGVLSREQDFEVLDLCATRCCLVRSRVAGRRVAGVSVHVLWLVPLVRRCAAARLAAAGRSRCKDRWGAAAGGGLGSGWGFAQVVNLQLDVAPGIRLEGVTEERELGPATRQSA